MARSGPLLLIEDDRDDIELMIKILQDIRVKNELITFPKTIQAFEYLKETSDKPFLILCDINLPEQNGLDFKKQIDADPELRRKSIPFIFYSTAADQGLIDKAYAQMTVQGFFEKGVSYEEIKDDVQAIINYWKRCKHPNIF